MARIAEPGLLGRIVEAATMAFIKHGYRGCRMEAVAEGAGVSVGTVYRYVDGKEAVFELAVHEAFGDFDERLVKTPFAGRGDLNFVDVLWRRLQETHPMERLREAAGREAPADPGAELEEIVRDLYTWQLRYWKALLLIERCAREWPELELLFYRQFRREALSLGASWIERRGREGAFVRVPDALLAARFIAESVAFFAMHRHTAPDSQDMDEHLVEETVVVLARNALVPHAVASARGHGDTREAEES
jgi:AcrR family transcriptional regulator